jgi:hypothetical protein
LRERPCGGVGSITNWSSDKQRGSYLTNKGGYDWKDIDPYSDSYRIGLAIMASKFNGRYEIKIAK